jgi:hypothetical protein
MPDAQLIAGFRNKPPETRNIEDGKGYEAWEGWAVAWEGWDIYLTSREHLKTEHSETIPSMFQRVAKRIACWRLEALMSAMEQDPDSVRNRIGILG